MARGGLAGLLLPPLLAFAVSRLVLSTAALSAGVSPAQPGSWCRFDCGHYTTIAVRGYEITPCPAGSRDEGALCGNTAWLPGYPLLVRTLHTLGVRPRRAAVLVSAAFALLSLALIWAALAGPWAGGKIPAPGPPSHSVSRRSSRGPSTSTPSRLSPCTAWPPS